MGDAAVSALAGEVIRRLTYVVIQKLALLWGFKSDILTLKEDFINIQAVLHDAEEKNIKEKEVDLWFKSLRSASLMVENVLDDVSTEAMLQRLHKERGINYKVRAFFSSNHNQFMFRVRIVHKVKAIRLKLDAIKSKRVEIGFTPGAIMSQVDVDIASEMMPDRETSSHIHDSSTIFGRNAEIEMVIEKICNKEIGKYDNDKIRVYGISGMGGLGKTTLAQLVYNDGRVIEYFEITCWIYVSEKFNVKEILKKIIESIDKSECKLTQLDTLQESLQNKLRGKRFLVVLDDVWIEENEKAKWDELSYTLSCGAEESIVVMTTRSNTTSRMMAKVGELQHELGYLSENDSWLLFKKFAFAQGRERDDISKLEPIGRELAKKCKGLPLAVKTLGSFMWSKRSTSDWEHVKDNNIWESQENKVLPALKLSYDNLVPHLKRCFAYCCLFPKGYYMEKDVVIQLWVSNGFIPPRGDIDLYVLGEEIFNCLVWRNFFIAEVNVFLEDRYIMHDLMHDMAQHVMGDDCLVIDYASKEVEIPNGVLHLSLERQDFHFPPHCLRKLTSLRSILMLRRNKFTQESHINQIFNHVYLRVLYLTGIKLRTLPESICKLKHLRYLNLSGSTIRVLPESIMYLQNLQYLNLSNSSIEVIPDSIIYLQNLQVLLLYNCKKLHKFPKGLRYMINLRKFPWFPISKKSGAKIGELGGLNLLKGELQISGLENVGGLSEAKSANLKCKANMSVLNLKWSEISERANRQEMFACDEKVLEGLEPNTSLKGLIITNYMGNIISPTWMFKLTNLVEITFYHCKKCEHIPPLGRLPNLRVIGLWDMDSLKCFYDDNNTDIFLCLQVLSISYCPRLVSLPRNLPKLKVLELKHCMDLVSLPDEIQSFKDLNELDIYNCKHLNERYEKELGIDWPKISHIPNISIVLPR